MDNLRVTFCGRYDLEKSSLWCATFLLIQVLARFGFGIYCFLSDALIEGTNPVVWSNISFAKNLLLSGGLDLIFLAVLYVGLAKENENILLPSIIFIGGFTVFSVMQLPLIAVALLLNSESQLVAVVFSFFILTVLNVFPVVIIFSHYMDLQYGPLKKT